MLLKLYSPQSKLDVIAHFPASGRGIQSICDKLHVDNIAKTEVEIQETDLLPKGLEPEIFVGKTCVLDELNLLTKQLTLLDEKATEIFTITATEYNYPVYDMIELTENTDNIILKSLDPDLVELAQYLAKRENLQGEDNFDFSLEEAKKFLCDFYTDLESTIVCGDKLLYQGYDYDEFFYGSCLPICKYDQSPLSVDLLIIDRDDGYNLERLYLPYHASELEKSLERLDAIEEKQRDKVEVELVSNDVSSKMAEFFLSQNLTLENLPHLNNVAEFLGENSLEKEVALLEMMNICQVGTLEEVSFLSKNFKQLDFYSNVATAEEFGKRLFEEIADTEVYLETRDYIDFEHLGQNKLDALFHVFTQDGLLTYSGKDAEMLRVLDKIQEQSQEMGGMT